MRRRSFLLAAVIALGGCSLSIDPDELDPLGSPEGYCRTLLGEALALSARCEEPTPLYVAKEYDRVLALCEGVGRSAAQGRVEYDPAFAASCVDALRSGTCALDLGALVEGCAEALVGRVPDGEACGEEFECANPEAQCAYADGTCPGTCRPPGGANDPCANGLPCGVGFYCSPSANTCQPALALGASCLTTGIPCGTGAYCSALGCLAYAKEGEACTARLCDPEDRLFCDSNNGLPATCKPEWSLPTGARCGSFSECNRGAYCDLTSSPGTCLARRPLDSDCASSEQCAPPLACLGASLAGGPGKCRPHRVVGETCTPDTNDCQLGAWCDAAEPICKDWPSAIGEPCSSSPFDAGCHAGRCVPEPQFEAFVCADYAPPGAGCTFDLECGPGGPAAGANCQPTLQRGSVCVATCL